MNKLSRREHARLARELIDHCGGLEEAAGACRVRKSALSMYQNPEDPSTMPADVMDALEEYAGQGPIYSSAVGNLGDAVCDFSELTLEVQKMVRKALEDGRLTPRELDRIAGAERELEEALERLKGTRRAAEAASINGRAA